jgi:glycosyltransferase involved in cell wall biosynthesis
MRLSIVIPCYNEAANIDELHVQLSRVGDRVDGEVEFVFVDDGSRDATLERLKTLACEDPRARVIGLSRNFGHQAALSAGMDYATGDAVVVMDADLQHPPELILEFLEKWREGYELVYAYREGVRPRLGYRLINALMKVHIPAEAADFRLMDRRLVDAFKRMPERARFIRGMISWLGFRQIGVGYEQRERFAGERSYTLRQTARMAFNAVLAFSNVPLRIASLLGVVILVLAMLYGVYILYCWSFGRPLEPGWTALIMTVLILGGVQLVSLGLIAEYIGRIFEEVKQRPLYVVREHVAPRFSGGQPVRPGAVAEPRLQAEETSGALVKSDGGLAS